MQHTTSASPFHRQLARFRRFCRLAALTQLLRPSQQSQPRQLPPSGPVRTHLPPLAWLAGGDPAAVPAFVQDSPLAMKYLHLLGQLDWNSFPQRSPARAWPGTQPQSPLPYVIALLIRLDQRQNSMGALVDLLRQRPELAWLAGFAAPLDAISYSPSRAAAAVPTPARFSQMLRRLPNTWLATLLDQTVRLAAAALPADTSVGPGFGPSFGHPFGEAVAFDTKHIVAWVKENNPKELLADRFDKNKQPKGDSDCKLGCKRRTNKGAAPVTSAAAVPPTPAKEGKSAARLGSGLGEFYWGYASGIAVTKVPRWGEFVLAERTATFDQPEVSYFFPLMQQVAHRLGRTPRFGTADAAFDAHYIYQYFHDAGGFAAIPNRFGDAKSRTFTPEGVPLCPAGLPMALLGSYRRRTSRIPAQFNRWVCPRLHGQDQAPPQECPIQHERWHKGGCRCAMPADAGARIRHQLDRHSDAYQQLYNQRTACERIFSQAVALGIERPKLRNRHSIANLNTLIYVLLNLRTLQRVHGLQTQLPAA